jgi:AcrR family transcriptional regulator
VHSLTDQLARRAAERSVAERQADYAREMQRIVDATFDLIERTGTLNPSLRDVLAASGLSTQGFYRYFRSKDELLLVLLDVGHRQLSEYLLHRMDRERDPAARVREWVLGVLAQAGDPVAAARTKPFVVGEARIAEVFPEEHRQSALRMAGVLAPSVEALAGRSGPVSAERVERSCMAVYDLLFAALRRHLLDGTTPSDEERSQLVDFVLGGIAGVAGPAPAPARPGGH